MSEPDNPRWLDDLGDELRQGVPVRAEWRAQLLKDIANTPRPSLDGKAGESGDDVGASRRRRVVLSPVAGMAAALLFTAIGAGGTLLVLGRGARNGTLAATDTVAPGANATRVSNATPSERETVRFELAAPRAAHVALVGSFNEWNPIATPLERDPATGKWIVSLRLPPGRHVYAFVVDGDVTADPTAPRAADDDFGSAKSVLLVSARSS